MADKKKDNSSNDDLGFFLKISNWLLSRLPWFESRYDSWSPTKRIVIALLLYLVLLPIIPIGIALYLFIKDPEGFKKSKAFPILGAIIAAQVGALGIIALQEPQTNINSDNSASQASSESRQKVEGKAESEPTLGQTFENCTEAFDAGVFNIPSSDPSYQKKLDGDSDGVACEK